MILLPTRRAGVLVALVLYAAAASAQAQSSAVLPASTPAYWYLGPQVGVQARIYGVDHMGQGLATRSVGLRGGYAPSGRLAVEAGVQCGRGERPAEELQGSGQFAYYPQTAQITRALTVPVGLRWSLACQPHRFSVSALVGASVCFFRLRETGTNTAAGTKSIRTADGINGYLDFGLGAQLRASRRVNVTLDVVPNLNLRRPINGYFPIAPGLNAALTVNYRLN